MVCEEEVFIVIKFYGIFLLYFTASYYANAADSFTLNSSAAPNFYYKTTSIRLFTESNGDGKTEATAPNVYIPVKSLLGGNDQYAYTTYSPATSIPLIADATYDLEFHVDIENASKQKVWVAIKDSSTSYKIAGSSQIHTDEAANDIPISTAVTFRRLKMSMLENICNASAGLDCASLKDDTSSTNKTFYVFMRDSTVTPTSPIDPTHADNSNGFYINVFVSALVRDNSSMNLKINLIERGDESLYIHYNTTSIFEGMQELLVLSNSSTGNGNQPYQDAVTAGSRLLSGDKEFPASPGASIQLRHLVNKTTYYISLAFKDKYGFASLLSVDKSGTPEEIEEFIKSQQCYLLSAGFGREHFIINYFKKVRDNFLLKSYLGRSFVSFYYETAPKYTKAIYTSKTLSFMVRLSAFVIYYIFKFVAPLFLVFLLIFTIRRLVKGKFLSTSESKSSTK